MPPRDNDSIESPLPHHQHLKHSRRKFKMNEQNKSRKSKEAHRPHSESRYLEEYRPLASRNPIYSSLFKNEEQITSSLAALDAASAHISLNALCLVLGDGRTPRTAVTAAIECGWNVVAIDEKLDEKWIQPRLPDTCRYIGFRGSMSDFLSEGMDLVQSRLCPIAAIQELVVICMETNGGYTTLKSLKGRLGVSDLRVLYHNVSATLVSLSSEENEQECPLKSKPNEAFVDEDILADNRYVQVWTFQGSRRLSDASSNPMPSTNNAGNKRSKSKVAQLQRQQNLARNNRMQSQKKLSTTRNEDDDSSSDEKKQRKSKPKRKSKSSQRRSTELVPVDNPQREPAVTVSSFLSRQKSMQKEQESYRSNYSADDKAMLLTNGEEDDYETNHSPISSKSPTVDTVPSDHPSSCIIQTHRTCTVCHRTLSRSQFSDRDRYLVHLSLGPGAVCRTCTMTVAATKLKMMPSHSQLLSDYAHRGEYLMKNGQLPALGYVPANDAPVAEGAMVLHDGNNAAGLGNQLVPFQHGPNDSAGTLQNPFMAPPMGVDVNAPFSGILPEEERPTHIADCKYIDAVLSMPCYPKLNSMELFSSSKDVSVSMAALDAIKLYGTMDAEYFVAHDGNGEKVVPRSMRKKMAASCKDSHTGVNPKSIVCLVIGEGSQPRTAVLASLHYGWTTLSIDPTLDEDWDGYQDDVPNYTGYSGTISEFMSDEYTESYFELDNSQSKVNHLVIIGVQMTKDELRLKGQSNINEIRARYNDIPTTLVSMSPLRKATLAPKRRNGQCGSKLEKDVGYEPNCSYIDEGVFSVCRLVEVWNFHNEDDGIEEEGSIEDDEYSQESIGDRNDRYRDTDYEKRFSQERLERHSEVEEAEEDNNNCSTYERFQKQMKRAEKDRKRYDEEKKRLSRKGTCDSLMSGSTLSTKETMMKKQSSKATSKSGALVPLIASRLEQENSRRKSKEKKKSRRRKSAEQSGRRPIPDDIPEDLEIDSSNFIGSGPQPDHQEIVEWNEQAYDDNYDRAGDDAIIERIDSHTDIKGGFKKFHNPVESHNLSDMWKGTVANYDEQAAQSDRSYRSYREKGPEDNMQEGIEEDNIDQNHDDKSFRSESSRGSTAGKAKDDHDSYSSKSDDDYCAKEKRNSEGTGEEYDHNSGNGDYSEHSSDEFDALRNQTEYYGYDDDQSSNDDVEDLPSTNSGIAALNEFNQSRCKLEDDVFPDYWSEDEDAKPPPTSITTSKRKPWHRKETQEHSFMSSYDSYE